MEKIAPFCRTIKNMCMKLINTFNARSLNWKKKKVAICDIKGTHIQIPGTVGTTIAAMVTNNDRRIMNRLLLHIIIFLSCKHQKKQQYHYNFSRIFRNRARNYAKLL